MKRRIAVLAATALLGAGAAMLAPANPASATWVCAGTGTATTTATYYPTGPITAAATTQPHVSLTWEIAKSPQGKTFSFSFAGGVGTCVNPETTSTAKTLTATGSFLGWCGLSSGNGVTGNGASFSWIGVGSLLILTGHLVGVVNATPDVPAGESCAPTGAGALKFLVTGGAVLTHCAALSTPVNQLVDTLVPIISTTQGVGPALVTVALSVHAQAHIWATVCTSPDPLLTL